MFDVDHVPSGATLVLAARGRSTQDDTGSTEPFTVLAPRGEEPSARNRVVVALTGYAGYQGGLDQASRGYVRSKVRRSRIDQQPAIYSGPGPDGAGGDLVVRVDARRALRVTARRGSRADLVRIARRTDPGRGIHEPPSVDPPPGWRVVGTADGSLASVLFGVGPSVGTSYRPGLSDTLALGWTLPALGGTRPTLTVMALPGRSGDLAAIAAEGYVLDGNRWGARSTRVAGRRALEVVSIARGGTADQPEQRLLAIEAENGDLVLVVAQSSRLTSADLEAVAASVHPVAARRWDVLRTKAAGGPGLHADPGATLIDQGIEGGRRWLLQVLPGSTGNCVGNGCVSGPAPDPGPNVSTCLKLDDGARPCADATAGTPGQGFVATADPTTSFPGFAVVQGWRADATAVRVLRPGGGHEDLPLRPVPGALAGARVVLGPRQLALCPLPTDGPSRFTAFQLLDAQGQVLACLG